MVSSSTGRHDDGGQELGRSVHDPAARVGGGRCLGGEHSKNVERSNAKFLGIHQAGWLLRGFKERASWLLGSMSISIFQSHPAEGNGFDMSSWNQVFLPCQLESTVLFILMWLCEVP